MKILIIQQAGHHEINKHFRESLCLQYGFEQLGHDAIVWGDMYPNYNSQTFNELENWCDVIFVIENYYFDWIPYEEINKSKKIKVWWTIDSHANLAAHKQFAGKINFDIVLSSTKRYLTEYPNSENYWFPNAYPSNLISPSSIEDKIVSIGFCGSLIPMRIPRLNYLQENYQLSLDSYIMGDEMVRKIQSYYLHFNQNISDDINYRTFETTGCKTALLTNYSPDLEELFDLDKDLLVYRSEEDLYGLLDKYLNDKTFLWQIANNGYKNSSENHTYTNRCKEFIDILK